MAKKEIKETKKSYKVKFNKPFDGSLNGEVIKVTRQDLKVGDDTREVSPEAKEWLKKFQVCDA